MRLFWAVLGVGVVVALCSPAFAADPPPLSLAKVDAAKEKEAYGLNVEGLKLHRKKDYAGAEAKYQAALAANPGHLWARYNLACVLVLSGKPDKALALLVEIGTAKGCAGCREVVLRSRFDDDWRTQWTEPAYWAALEQEPPPDEGAPGEDAEPTTPRLACPKGTAQKGKWRDDRSLNEIYCAKPDGTRHGPYVLKEEGYELDEGVRGQEGSYKDGKKDGLWWEYESFGPSFEGAYVNGQRHGLWITFHKEDTTYEAYVQGKQDGRSRTLRDGKLVREEHWAKGELHGPSRWWYDDPYVLAEEGAYDHGKKHGTWVAYDDTGRKRAVSSFDHGKRHGPFEWFDAKGRSLGKVTMDQDSGAWVAYDLDGKVVEEGKLVAGQREGRWGLAEGAAWSEGEYAKGKETGVWTRYHQRGGIKLAEGAYKEGKRTGPWTFWNEKGQVVAKGSYVADKPDGAWMVSNDGDERQDLVFKKGKLVKIDGARPSKDEIRGYEFHGFGDPPTPIQGLPEGVGL